MRVASLAKIRDQSNERIPMVLAIVVVEARESLICECTVISRPKHEVTDDA